MKLLFLTPYLPSPPRSGGSMRLHGLISNLARSHEVSVLSFVDPRHDHSSALAATRSYCQDVALVPNPRFGMPTRSKRVLQLGSLLSPYSFERLCFHRAIFQRELDRMTRANRFDIITSEFSLMGYYRMPIHALHAIDAHNVEHDILYRTYRLEEGLSRKVYNYVDYQKLRREERQIWRRAHGCSLTSRRDEELLLRDVPALPTCVAPNAVDTNHFRPRRSPPEPATLMFFGELSYYPNTDGLQFFFSDVLPHLKRRVGDLKVLIVGPSPPPTLTRWQSQDVVFTGFVDDVRDYLQRASVVITPLRIGGGTRLKVLEAMAMGKPLVSTSIGAEGISVSHERDILLADTPEDFARQVWRALDDSQLAHRLGLAARKLVETQYDWQASAQTLEEFYVTLLERGRECRR